MRPQIDVLVEPPPDGEEQAVEADVVRASGKADRPEVDGVVVREDRETVRRHHDPVREIVFARPGEVGGHDLEATGDAPRLAENVAPDRDDLLSDAVACAHGWPVGRHPTPIAV